MTIMITMDDDDDDNMTVATNSCDGNINVD